MLLSSSQALLFQRVQENYGHRDSLPASGLSPFFRPEKQVLDPEPSRLSAASSFLDQANCFRNSEGIFKQFLVIVSPFLAVSGLMELIDTQYRDMYPEEKAVRINILQDKHQSDLFSGFLVGDVFGNNDDVFVKFEFAKEMASPVSSEEAEMHLHKRTHALREVEPSILQHHDGILEPQPKKAGALDHFLKKNAENKTATESQPQPSSAAPIKIIIKDNPLDNFDDSASESDTELEADVPAKEPAAVSSSAPSAPPVPSKPSRSSDSSSSSDDEPVQTAKAAELKKEFEEESQFEEELSQAKIDLFPKYPPIVSSQQGSNSAPAQHIPFLAKSTAVNLAPMKAKPINRPTKL